MVAAKKKRASSRKQPDSFPVTLGEFCGSLAKPESQKAFRVSCEAVNEFKQRTPDEWKKLFDHFMCRPTKTPWVEWHGNFK